jgi:chromosome segregation protein
MLVPSADGSVTLAAEKTDSQIRERDSLLAAVTTATAASGLAGTPATPIIMTRPEPRMSFASGHDSFLFNEIRQQLIQARAELDVEKKLRAQQEIDMKATAAVAPLSEWQARVDDLQATLALQCTQHSAQLHTEQTAWTSKLEDVQRELTRSKEETASLMVQREALVLDHRCVTQQLDTLRSGSALKQQHLEESLATQLKMVASTAEQLHALQLELEARDISLVDARAQLEQALQEIQDTRQSFEQLRTTATEIEAHRDELLAQGQVKDVRVAELEEQVDILQTQSSRMSFYVPAAGASAAGKEKKTCKEIELEEQLRVLQTQRLEDFKSFELKMVDKATLLAQGNAKLSNALTELAQETARRQEFSAALEDATAQLQVLRGTVTLSASESELLELQQSHREVSLALELAQHEVTCEKQSVQRLEEELARCQAEIEGNLHVHEQLLQAQTDLSQASVESAGLKDIINAKGKGSGDASKGSNAGQQPNQAQKDMDKLKSRLEVAELKVKQAFQDRAMWTSEKSTLESQVKKFTKQVQLLEKENEKVKSLTATKLELTTQLRIVEKKHEHLTKANDKLQQDHEHLTAEQEQWSAKCEQQSQRQVQLEAEHSTLQARYRDLEDQVATTTANLQTRITEVEAVRDSLQHDLCALQEHAQTLQHNGTELEKEYHALQLELEQCQQQLRSTQEQLEHMTGAHDVLQNHCQQQTADLETLQMQAQHMEHELTERVCVLEQERDDVLAQKQLCEQSLETSHTATRDLEAAYATATTQVEQLQLDLAASAHQKTELRLRVECLEPQFEHSEAQRAELQQLVRDAELQRSMTAAELQEVAARFALNVDRTTALQEQLETNTAQVERLQAMLSGSNALNQHLQQQMTASCEQAKEWHVAREAMQSKLTVQDTELRELSVKLQECQSQLQDHQMQLRHATQQLETEQQAHTSTQDCLTETTTKLEHVLKMVDGFRQGYTDAVAQAKGSNAEADEFAAQVASLQDDLQGKIAQAAEMKHFYEAQIATLSTRIQEHCGETGYVTMMEEEEEGGGERVVALGGADGSGVGDESGQ